MPSWAGVIGLVLLFVLVGLACLFVGAVVFYRYTGRRIERIEHNIEVTERNLEAIGRTLPPRRKEDGTNGNQ